MKTFTTLALATLLAACGTSPVDLQDDPLAYDDTTSNFKAQGTLLGEKLEILQVVSVSALREYGAPPLAGTENDPDPTPDLTRATLTGIELEGEVDRDGRIWKFELDIEGPDLSAFAEGIMGVAAPVEVQLQLEDEENEIELEDVAISGSIDVIEYASSGGHSENDEIRLGGALGGTYELELAGGDRVKGAFYADFTEPEFDVQ
jgi:hypothetical protein